MAERLLEEYPKAKENYESENFLFQNDGTGKFEEVGLMTGVAYDLDCVGHGSMGVECGDFEQPQQTHDPQERFAAS
ncbi:MAG: hypothetical protein GY809_07240 [Planctomycetes bacterium]|nr:hypothetical protein [Planctomycetota bacterium]